MKECTVCNEVKKLDDFHVNPSMITLERMRLVTLPGLHILTTLGKDLPINERSYSHDPR